MLRIDSQILSYTSAAQNTDRASQLKLTAMHHACRVFGPSAKAARLEGSKRFMKVYWLPAVADKLRLQAMQAKSMLAVQP